MEDMNALHMDVKLDVGQAIKQAENLIQLLKTANSLVGELAAALNDLELDIKV